MQLVIGTLILCLSILLPEYAHAYIGPGLGAGTIGVVLGIIGSVLIAIFAIVWYPLKRFFKKKKSKQQAEENSAKL